MIISSDGASQKNIEPTRENCVIQVANNETSNAGGCDTQESNNRMSSVVGDVEETSV